MILAVIVSVAIIDGNEAPLYEAKIVFSPEDFHNHSPSIVEMPGGDFLVCWFHCETRRIHVRVGNRR